MDTVLEIALASYASVATVIIVIMSICLCRMRKTHKECPKCSIDKTDVNIRKAYRKSVNNVYEAESSTQSTKMECFSSMALISPPAPETREYESITGDQSSYSAHPTVSKDSEITDTSASTNVLTHEYATVVESVASTLNELHHAANQSKENFYDLFLRELCKNLKNKNSKVYAALQQYGLLCQNQYEVIDEKNLPHPKSTSADEYDCDYASYVPSKKIKSLSFSHERHLRKDYPKQQYGSEDHLKYLKETKSDLTTEENSPYLQAKQFVPTSECPENLQALINQNSSLKPTRRESLMKQETLLSQSEKETLTKAHSNTTQSALSNKVLQQKQKPAVPPKLRTRSNRSISEESTL